MLSGLTLTLSSVTNVKNQTPDFKQLSYTKNMKSPLMLKQSHTKTSSTNVIAKLLYVAKGIKYRWSYHDDVMQFSTLHLPKPCRSVGVSNLQP